MKLLGSRVKEVNPFWLNRVKNELKPCFSGLVVNEYEYEVLLRKCPRSSKN